MNFNATVLKTIFSFIVSGFIGGVVLQFFVNSGIMVIIITIIIFVLTYIIWSLFQKKKIILESSETER